MSDRTQRVELAVDAAVDAPVDDLVWQAVAGEVDATAYRSVYAVVGGTMGALPDGALVEEVDDG